MTSRRTFITVGVGALVATLAACGGGGDAGGAPPVVTPPPVPPPSPPPAPPVTNAAPAWSTGFTGANLAIGESLDLRIYTTDADGDTLTFSFNPGSTPVAGVLTLTPAGVLTRVGGADVAGVLIDADDGK